MDIGPTGLIGQFVQSPVEVDFKPELVCATILLPSMVVQAVLALEQKPQAAISKHVKIKEVNFKISNKGILSF